MASVLAMGVSEAGNLADWWCSQWWLSYVCGSQRSRMAVSVETCTGFDM